MASYLLRTILCLNLVASVSYLVFKASAFAGRKHISEKWRYNCPTVIMFLYVIPFYKLLPAFPKTLAEAEPISVVGNKVVSGIFLFLMPHTSRFSEPPSGGKNLPPCKLPRLAPSNKIPL